MAEKSKKLSMDDLLSKYSPNQCKEFVSTGSITLDKMLGGGINPGSMYAFWGAPGAGKSTITCQIAKRFCKEGKRVLFIDAEKALNDNQIDSFGLRKYIEDGTFVPIEIDNYQDLSEVITGCYDSGEFSLVIVDSDTAIHTVADLTTLDVASAQPGVKSRQEQATFGQMHSLFHKKGIAGIILCHARANIQMTGMANPYAPADKMSGGFGFRHCVDCVVKVSPSSKLKDKAGNIEGQELSFVCEKNKFSMPFVKYSSKFYFGKGLNRKVELIDLGIEHGIITASGSFYTMPGGTKVQGRDNLYVADIPDSELNEIAAKLEDILKES